MSDLPAEVLVELYPELRKIARWCMMGEREDHTLQPTALVHEAYMRLTEQRAVNWTNKAQVLGIAARLMRRVLVDHARHRNAQKRWGTVARVELEQDIVAIEQRANVDLITLNEAIEGLRLKKPDFAEIIDLYVFSGLSIEEIAGVFEESPSKVQRGWDKAKRRLQLELSWPPRN